MSLDVYLKDADDGYVFDYNITHNLGRMAREAGLYLALWRPEDIGATKAGHLTDLLEKGLLELIRREDHFKTFNPENGWGSYDGLLSFVLKYLAACHKFPEAEIEVSR